MSRLPSLGLVALLLTAAGCITLPEDAETIAQRENAAQGNANMTAKESTVEAAGLCDQGLNFGVDNSGRFCATRTITIEGALTGISRLDVSLETFNGDVKIEEGPVGRWGLVASLEARGDSAAEATSRLDDIAWRWAHEAAGAHFLEAVAEPDGKSDHLEADITLTMPRGLVMTLVAASSNGDVEIASGTTDGLALATSNGDITVQAEVTQVSLTTSNGDVDASLRPLSNGRWVMASSNGDVTLTVPEGAAYGYDIDGSTSNGEVDYTLKDGDKGPCPQGSEYYTPPCNQRTFLTKAFHSRDRQVTAQLSTSNGDVDAGPQ